MKNPLVLSLVLLLVVCVGVFVYWCNLGYGKVSDDAGDVARALYGVCLNESQEQLAIVEQRIDPNAAPETRLQLSERERGWLSAIVRKASEGDWKSAAASARQMSEDQVE